MNPKLKARIDSLLGEFDKLADKRSEEYEQSIKAAGLDEPLTIGQDLAGICGKLTFAAMMKTAADEDSPKVFTEFDSEGNPIYHIRAEPMRPNELLYDSKGLIVAIKTKGQILAILKGDA